VHQLQSLLPCVHVQVGHARQVTSGSTQAADKSNLNRVDRYLENDRNGRSRRLRRHCRRGAAASYNHGHLPLNEFSRKDRQAIIVAFSPAIFDRDVLALDIACLFQSLAERTQTDRVRVRRCAA
jgi:hypothetical protein